jgi:hypothetical protein
MFQMRAPAAAGGAAAAPDAPGDPALRRFLSRRSRLYGLARRARHETARLLHDATAESEAEWAEATAFAEAHPDYCQVFDGGSLRTVFTSEYRHAALDLGDPRIAEGLRISLEALRRMQARAAAAGVRFLVVLVPTKEAVFRDAWQEPSASYRSLVENEERLWQLAQDFLARNGIEHVDALPALRQALAAGRQPYPVSYDGHPNASGHGVIATLVAAHLEPSARRART